MCLAVPAQIVELKDNDMACVDIMGVTRDVALDLVPDAKVGDYVLVHAGFAIERVDADYAHETLELVTQMADLVDELYASDGLGPDGLAIEPAVAAAYAPAVTAAPSAAAR